MSQELNILLSNDDGIHAEGINALFDALVTRYRVRMVAPSQDCSGKSQALTLDRPLRVQQLGQHKYAVDGTPADCIQLGLAHIVDAKPDIVISGINHGANLGDDVIYSGTVGAAREARHVAKLAIAVSLVGREHFATAVWAVERLLQALDTFPRDQMRLLNVNVPDLPIDQIKGMRVCALGERPLAQPAQPTQDPKGHTLWWLGRLNPGQGEDFQAIEEGYVSVTPLSADSTDSQALASAQNWINK